MWLTTPFVYLDVAQLCDFTPLTLHVYLGILFGIYISWIFLNSASDDLRTLGRYHRRCLLLLFASSYRRLHAGVEESNFGLVDFLLLIGSVLLFGLLGRLSENIRGAWKYFAVFLFWLA